MTNWDFPCSDPVDISVDSWPAGSIVVAGQPTTELTVEVLPSRRNAGIAELIEQVQVSFEDGQLYVHGPRFSSFRRNKGLDLIIKAPAGSSCAAKTASADLACVGELSALAMQTASGDLTADLITGDVTVQSASGDVLLNKAGGNLTIRTASGDIRAREVEGDVGFNTSSGDVTVGYCAGSVAAQTTSGDIEIGSVATGRLELASTSGDIEVAVVPGLGVYLDLVSTSGDIRSDLEPTPDEDGDSPASVEIRCRSLSGDIRIRKAKPRQRPSSEVALPESAPAAEDARPEVPRSE